MYLKECYSKSHFVASMYLAAKHAFSDKTLVEMRMEIEDQALVFSMPYDTANTFKKKLSRSC